MWSTKYHRVGLPGFSLGARKVVKTQFFVPFAKMSRFNCAPVGWSDDLVQTSASGQPGIFYEFNLSAAGQKIGFLKAIGCPGNSLAGHF